MDSAIASQRDPSLVAMSLYKNRRRMIIWKPSNGIWPRCAYAHGLARLWPLFMLFWG